MTFSGSDSSNIKKWWGFLSLLLCFLMLSGFNFSDPNKLRLELRKEIKKELEKIIEKTPSGKLRTTWRQKKEVAADSLNKALLASAPKFCPDKWDEAVLLFKKARKYAGKREYRKAIYLAKKTTEFAQGAKDCALKYINKKRNILLGKYRRLRKQMDEVQAIIPPDAEELLRRGSELSLQIEDLLSAIDLRQFNQAEMLWPSLEKRLSTLEGDVEKYRQEHESQEGL